MIFIIGQPIVSFLIPKLRRKYGTTRRDFLLREVSNLPIECLVGKIYLERYSSVFYYLVPTIDSPLTVGNVVISKALVDSA